ncbi:MAG: EAL domain-containing protein [Epsilonproteobacteria bacterium]|nr:EAL domain-containing protein [Campylobacterota bacterium]
MNLLELLKQSENKLFAELKNDIKKDMFIGAKIPQEKLEKLLNLQEVLLREYLEGFQNGGMKDEKIRKFYKDFDIPYEAIYRGLNLLRDKFLLLLKKEDIKLTDVYDFSGYFQHLLDIIAKVYIKRMLGDLKKVSNTLFGDKLLIAVHKEWINQIIIAIEREELEYYPLITLKECKFNRYLYYPESLMICLDKKLCVYLEEMHKMMHRLADTLYLHLKNLEYSEAYFVFKDFVNQSVKFVETIADMYYVTYSNPERSLLKFLELVGFEKELFVSMVSFKNYASLCEEYGEEAVNEALEKIYKRIDSIVDKSHTIVIKGFNFNLFIANIDISIKKYKELVYSLGEYFSTEIDGKKIEFKPVVIGFEVDMYKSIKAHEIIEILDLLKDKAVKNNEDVLIMVDEDKEAINQLIADKYDGKFILSAFDRGEIEIVAQPIFDKEGNIFALEVLGRIKDLKKLVPMKDIIKKIEDMGLVRTLDLLVGMKLRDYSRYIPKLTDILFLNVSFDTLMNKQYLQNLKEFQEKYGVSMILEVSEIDFLAQYKVLENIYKEYNLRFAIDNFESQCISLKKFAYLVEEGIVKYLKVSNCAFGKHKDGILDVLKFLHDSYKVDIVIKHVEDKETLLLIQKYGFDYVQGFLLEKPKKIDEILLHGTKPPLS